MRFFFRSRKFKLLAAVLSLTVIIAVVLFAVGETAMPGGSIIDTVTAPFRAVANWATEGVSNIVGSFSDRKQLAEENSRLESENAELISELLEYQKALTENEELKKYLEIKERNGDFIMEPATVVLRDSSDPYGGFTVNRGSLDGVALRDPVITEKGLVGYVSEVGLSYAKVTTILDSEISIAAVDRRTSDIGVAGGSLSLAAEGRLKLYNIQRTAMMAVGDYVVSSGGGVFPEGLLIGRISSVGSENDGMSLYAELEPAVDVASLKSVMIITYFSGQGMQ